MSALREAIDEQARVELQRAVRALLRRPLLTVWLHEEELGLVRRHARELQAFFAEHVGWALSVDRETARLRKVPPTRTDGSRPARGRPQDPPFSRRRYVLLCLALAALERTDRQTTLRRVAEAVAAMVAEDDALAAAGVEFSLEGREQRRDLIAIVRWLLDHGVLARVEGDEESFVADQGDALYRVDRQVLAQLLVVQCPPSTVVASSLDERVEAVTEELRLESDEARRRALRFAWMRRLLDDPVVHFDEVTAEELDYFTRSRSPMLARLEEMTGLCAELRAEGVALVDQFGDASDLALPEEGTDGHVALLLAELLAERARAEPGRAVAVAELHSHVRGLAEEHRAHWRKAATEPGAEVDLTERALALLCGLRLARREGDGVVPLAAIGRFALSASASSQQEELTL